MDNIFLNKTDSRYFGCNIVGWNVLKPLNTNDIAVQLKEILKQYDPALITVFLPVGDIISSGNFPIHEFQFIECRLLIEKELTEPTGSYITYPYEFLEVTQRNQLNRLKKACENMFFDDRFFTDPLIDDQLAFHRNIFFLEQSYTRKNEFIYILQNSNTNEILGFRSFQTTSKAEASMLISGYISEKKEENFQELINLLELETLHETGIQLIKAVISVQNYDEINRYISKYGYKIYDSKILLRKLLKPLRKN